MTLRTHDRKLSCAAISRFLAYAQCIAFVLLLLATTTSGQETITREKSAVYPLDGVAKPDGTVFVVDRNLPGIWKRSAEANTVFVQGDRQFRKPLNAVRCIELAEDGTLYVGDSATREIYRIGEDAKPIALTSGLIGVPVDIACASDGTLYVADLERRAIWKWNPNKNEQPSVYADKANARGITVDHKDRLWVLSQNAQQLLRYEQPDQATPVIDKRVFEFAHNVIVDEDDTAWVSDGYAKAVWKVSPGAEPIKAITSDSFRNPVGLFKSNDKIMIVDPHAATVFAATRDGKVEVAFKIEKASK